MDGIGLDICQGAKKEILLHSNQAKVIAYVMMMMIMVMMIDDNDGDGDGDGDGFR